MGSTFLCLTANGWTAVGTIALVIVTGALVFVARRQVVAAREENRKTQTLNACGQYDLSPVMFDCIQKIRNAQESGALKRNPKKFRRQMVTILNFLDAIAIGIEQELYVEDLAYDHLEAIVKSFVRDLIDSGLIVKAGYPIEHWRRLIALRDRWQQGRPIPS